jgi:hypothetical protein
MDTFKITSGFTISVKPLAPYYMDFIEDYYPMPEFPSRKITLASGDIIDYEYILPEIPPVDTGEDMDLFIKYKFVEKEREKVTELRARTKRDFLLSTCVFIEPGGPVDFDEKDWEYRVEAAFPKYVIPTHPGKRRLVFLKAIVITTKEDMDLIIQRCLHQEVNMQSVLDALRGFRSKVA